VLATCALLLNATFSFAVIKAVVLFLFSPMWCMCVIGCCCSVYLAPPSRLFSYTFVFGGWLAYCTYVCVCVCVSW
jgi:hypothetical protein